jgi:hypothetical protein
VILLRTIEEDPLSRIHLAALSPAFDRHADAIAQAWADAQAAADATLLGSAVGVRVALLPEAGQWFAEVVVIWTRAKIRLGSGDPDPLAALKAAHRLLVAAVADGSDLGPIGSSVFSPLPQVASGGRRLANLALSSHAHPRTAPETRPVVTHLHVAPRRRDGQGSR